MPVSKWFSLCISFLWVIAPFYICFGRSGFELSVRKPPFGSEVDLYCPIKGGRNEGGNSEFLAFQLFLSHSESVHKKIPCLNVSIESVVNYYPIVVTKNIAICPQQDYVWTLKNVCQKLSPFKEGHNFLQLSLYGTSSGDAVHLNLTHIFSIDIEYTEDPDPQDSDVSTILCSLI